MASSGMTESDFKENIRNKLIDLLNSDVESLVRVLYYLDEEDKVYSAGLSIGPVWKTLQSTITYEEVFKQYALRLVQDTKTAENDPSFREKMNAIYAELMETSTNPEPLGNSQAFEVERLFNVVSSSPTVFGSLASAWERIPAAGKLQIIQLIPKFGGNQHVVTIVNNLTGLTNRIGGNVVMIGLASLQLCWTAIQSLTRWWNGEITGARCAKIIIDSSFSVTAGCAGGLGGAAAGSFAGPIGTIAGAIGGSIIASKATELLVDRLTQWIFELPKDEALEKAYNYLGVKMTASNFEVNKAFHELCLKHHPDKGGKNEDFHILQLHMGVIKLARHAM